MCAGLILAGSAASHAQVVATGTLDFVSPEDGTFRLRSDQLGGQPRVYFGMNAANILTLGGYPLTVDDLYPGCRVTVYFVRGRRQWLISKVLVEEPQYLPFPNEESYYQVPTRIVPRSGLIRRIP